MKTKTEHQGHLHIYPHFSGKFPRHMNDMAYANNLASEEVSNNLDPDGIIRDKKRRETQWQILGESRKS